MALTIDDNLSAGTSSEPEHRGASLGFIFRNLGWMVGGKTFSAILSVGYLAIATRTLGIDRFGKFALALGIGQAVAVLVACQSWQVVVRYGMPHLVGRRRDPLARLLNFTFRLDLASALVGAALVCAVMPLLGLRFGWSQSFVWQAAGMGVILVLSIRDTPIGILRLHDRYATAVAAEAVTPAVRLIGAVLAWQFHPTPLVFMATWALSETLTTAACWWSALRVTRGAWTLPRPLRWADVKAENPGIGEFTLSTSVNSSLDLGGKQVAVLIVGLLVTPAAAGGYRLVQQLSQAMAKTGQMVARAIYPELMRSRATVEAGETHGARFDHLLAGIGRIARLGAVTVFVLLIVVGKPLLGLVAGHEYLSAYPVLLLLGTAAAINFAAVGFEPALVAMGRPGLVLRLNVAITALLVALMIVLTLRFDAVGAGMAMLVASSASFGLLWLNARRVIGASSP